MRRSSGSAQGSVYGLASLVSAVVISSAGPDEQLFRTIAVLAILDVAK